MDVGKYTSVGVGEISAVGSLADRPLLAVTPPVPHGLKWGGSRQSAF